MRFTPTGSPFRPMLTVHFTRDGDEATAWLLSLVDVYRALEVVVEPPAWLVSEVWA